MVNIVSGGTSSYAIAVPSSPTVVENTAAAELRDYIKKLSGATLPIVSEGSAPATAIFIGGTAFALAQGIVPTGAEAWHLKLVGNRLILAGGRNRGVLYGVYRLLEDQWGVHWWNAWEEQVPTTPTLVLASTFESSGEPAFASRDMYDGLYDPGSNAVGVPATSLFYARNRLNGAFSLTPPSHGGNVAFGWPYHVHTFEYYMPPEQYFDTHPEYFSLISGARTRNGQLCLTNASVKSIVAQKVRDYIVASYANADAHGMARPKIFSLTPNDWPGFCEHSACAALRAAHGDSGYLLTFVNEIAADVGADYPEVMFDTLAYWFYVDPPVGVVPASNVQIRFANIDYDIIHDLAHANHAALRTKLEGWTAISPNVWFWGYQANFYVNPPYAMPLRQRVDAQYLRSSGVKGVMIEVEGSIYADMWDLNSWVLAKQLEDPDVNLTTMIEVFTWGYYGSAAPKIIAILNATKALLDSTSTRVTFSSGSEAYGYYTLAFVNGLNVTFNEAESAVAGDATRLRRVRHARASLDRLILMRWSALVAESQSSSVALGFTRKTVARRLIETLKAVKAQRTLATSDVQPFNELYSDYLLRISVIPTALWEIPLRCMSDGQYDQFRLWTGNGGVSLVDDAGSLIGRAARINLPDVDTPANRLLNAAPIPVGLYTPSSGATKPLRSIPLAELVPDQYTIYPCGSTRLSSGDYIFLSGSWWIQLDVAALIAGKPANQEYDIYVSMKVRGAAYGGSAAHADSIWVDRIILVAKGTYPAAIASIDVNRSTDFEAESFRLALDGGGVSRWEDGTSLTRRSASITLSRIKLESDRAMHIVSASAPIPIGLYNAADGQRTLRTISPAQIVPDAWAVYSISDVQIKPQDYLFLFGSWWIQQDLAAAVASDPAQRYDIHVSIKFTGPAYGGSITQRDAIFVDRIVVVQR